MLTDFFNSLDGEQQYILMSAIRGPDEDDNYLLNTLKHKLVSRIRYIIFGDWPGSDTKCPTWTSNIFDELDYKETIKILSNLYDNNVYEHTYRHHHYIFHLRDAMNIVKGHLIWGVYGVHIAASLIDGRLIDTPR